MKDLSTGPQTQQEQEETTLNLAIAFLVNFRKTNNNNPKFEIRGKDTKSIQRIWATLLWFRHISYNNSENATGRAILNQVLAPGIDLRTIPIKAATQGPELGTWSRWQKSRDFDYIREHMPVLFDKNSTLLKNTLDNLMKKNTQPDITPEPALSPNNSKPPSWLVEENHVATNNQASSSVLHPGLKSEKKMAAKPSVDAIRTPSIPEAVLDLSHVSVEKRRVAAQTLCMLAHDVETNKDLIRDAGAISPLIRLLTDTDIVLKQHVIAALSNLAGNVSNKAAIAAAGGIPFLVNLLNETDAYLKQNAIGVLWNLSIKHPANQTIIASSGAIPLLVKLLNDNDIVVKRNVTAALWNIADVPANTSAIAIAGGIAPMIKLLCDEDVTVRNYATGVLLNLARNPESLATMISMNVLPILKRLVAENNDNATKDLAKEIIGILEIATPVETLRANIKELSNANVQIRREATGVVRRLAYQAGIVREAGGIAPLIKLLGDDDPSIRRDAAKALKDTAGTVLDRHAIRDAGGIVPLVKLLGDRDEKARHRAAGVLVKMAEDETNHHAIRAAGGVALLVHLLKDTDIKAQENAAWALWILAYNTLNHNAICEAGGIVSFISLLNTSNESMKKNIVDALWHLVEKQPANQVMMIDRGALPLLNKLASTDENARNILKACQVIIDNRQQEKKAPAIKKTNPIDAFERPFQDQKLPSTFSESRVPTISSSSLQIDRNQKIGQGGFGVVYKGTWQMVPVAIKQLHASKLSADVLKLFQKEAHCHGLLRHPHVVMLYGICAEPGNYSMVMELMVGGSLYDLLHSTKDIPWKFKLSIAHNISVGLYYLHENNIIHRDLKSLNVLLDDRNQARLADFGLATVKSEIRSHTTASTTTPGTVRWMAPELFILGSKCTVASDIYALGWVFWELSSHKVPFQDTGHATDALIRHWVKEDGEREAIPLNTPPKFAHLLTQCWAQRAEDRPGTAKAVAEAIPNTIEEPDLSSSYAYYSQA